MPGNYLLTSTGKTVKDFDEDLAKVGKNSHLTANAVRKLTQAGKPLLAGEQEPRLNDQLCHSANTANKNYHLKTAESVVKENDTAVQQAHFNVRIQEVIIPNVAKYFEVEAPAVFPERKKVENFIFTTLKVTNDAIEVSTKMFENIEAVWLEKSLPSYAAHFAAKFHGMPFNKDKCMKMIEDHPTWGKKAGRRQELLLEAEEVHSKKFAKVRAHSCANLNINILFLDVDY